MRRRREKRVLGAGLGGPPGHLYNTAHSVEVACRAPTVPQHLRM